MSPSSPSRTLRALELVAAAPVSAPQLADDLSVDPRTARALLDRLVADGYLIRRARRPRRYAAGPRLHALAATLILRREASARAPVSPPADPAARA